MRERGFTLLELMIVAALLGLMAALLLPRLGLSRSDVGQARTTLSSLIRLIRTEAISTGKPHQLRVDPKTRRCVPEVYDGERFVPLEDPLALARDLPVDRISLLLTAAGPAQALRIQPSGFVEPALLEVEVREEVSTLAIHALTGKVETRPGPARPR
jgi:type II secretion system protein H